MRRILITGVAGFIGHYLAKLFLESGYKVRGLDNLSTGLKARIEPFLSHPNFEWVEGDIQNEEDCQKACHNQDFVSHHAAMVSVPESIKNPVLCHAQNVTGTLNMLQAAKEAKVKRFILASSCAVYGNAKQLPIMESHPTDPQSPYAVSKLIGEKYCQLFTELYGLKTVMLRYFNVYGAGQDANSAYAAVIPKFIEALKQGKSPVIYGDGEQVRDFVSVQTVAEANLAVCEKEIERRDIFNIGSGHPTTINALFSNLAKQFNTDVQPTYLAAREGEIRDSWADCTRAKKIVELSFSEFKIV